MKTPPLTIEQLEKENAGLRERLREAEDTVETIRSGGVDAIMVYGSEGEKIFTLEGADQPYRVFIENMREGAATIGPNLIILYCNARLAEMAGRPLEQVIGSSLSDLAVPEDRAMLGTLIEQGCKATAKAEVRLQKSGGGQVRTQFSISPLPVERTVCLIATDMSQGELNRELAASERLARAILDRAQEAIVVCDEQGLVIRASEEAERLCSGNPVLRPFAEAFPITFVAGAAGTGATPPADAHELVQTVLNGQPFRGLEAELRPPGRPLTYVLLTAGPIDLDSEGRGLVITLMDISQRRQDQAALLEQQESARALSTPVLQLREHLLLVPLIGVLDGGRARQLTEHLLHGVRLYRAKVVVIDVTGVAAIDAAVANHLVQAVEAARLMGARVIMTGISRNIAQTLIAIDVDFGRMMTMGTLRSGLEEAERLLAVPAAVATRN